MAISTFQSQFESITIQRIHSFVHSYHSTVQTFAFFWIVCFVHYLRRNFIRNVIRQRNWFIVTVFFSYLSGANSFFHCKWNFPPFHWQTHLWNAENVFRWTQAAPKFIVSNKQLFIHLLPKMVIRVAKTTPNRFFRFVRKNKISMGFLRRISACALAKCHLEIYIYIFFHSLDER